MCQTQQSVLICMPACWHVLCRYKAEKLQLDGRLYWNPRDCSLPFLDVDGEGADEGNSLDGLELYETSHSRSGGSGSERSMVAVVA
jgi:hypothetical protein